MDNKAIVGTTAMIIAVVIIGGIGGGTYVAYDNGYLPVKELLPTRAPPEGIVVEDPTGTSVEPDIDCCKTWFKNLAEDYKVEELKLKLYTVDGFIKDLDNILEKYNDEMIEERFEIYENNFESALSTVSPSIWKTTHDGHVIYCGLWIKGWTFVSVFVTKCPTDLPIFEKQEGSSFCVLYMTGHVDSYKKVFADSGFLPPIKTECSSCSN